MMGRLTRAWIAATAACLGALCAPQTAPAPATSPPTTDPLGRQSPRSSVTGFLEACRSGDYQRASQYLDLRQFSAGYREARGPELSKELEGILNSDSQFNLLRLNRNPEGDLTDDSDPNREHVATIAHRVQNITLNFKHITLQRGGTTPCS